MSTWAWYALLRIMIMIMTLKKLSTPSQQIQDAATLRCLDVWQMNGPIKLTPCHNEGGNQYFTVTKLNTIMNNGYCLDVPFGPNKPLQTAPCVAGGALSQQFDYSQKVRTQ